jgi:FkbM family methyltransferase
MKPSPRGIRVARRLIYRVLHAGRSAHPIEFQCCGVRFRIESSSRIGEDLYANGFERQSRGLLDQIIAPGSIVVDVGANIGFYTCLFAKKVGSTGKVIAVEPTPSVFQSLCQNIRLNRMNDRVLAIQAALSSEQGVSRLNVFPEGQEVYNSLGATNVENARGSIEVDTRTLDSVLDGISDGRQCIVKIDVEGFENTVLRGGINRLRRMTNIALMVEINDHASQQCGSSSQDSLELLRSCGFRPYVTNDGKSLEPLKSSANSGAGLNDNVFFFKDVPSLARAA